MIKLAVFLAAALSAAVPAWAVNKCTGPDGKVMFQDAPCPGTGITVAEDLARKKEEREKDAAGATKKKAENPTSVDVDQMVKAAMQKNEEALAAARARCKNGLPEYPAIGMPEDQFRNCTQFGVLTPYSDLNQTETAAGVSKQYVYSSRVGGIRYVYTRNGVVSAIQR